MRETQSYFSSGGGNVIVDKAAKVGAAFHPHDEAVLAKTKKAHVLVKEVAKYLGRAAEQRWDIGKTELKIAQKRAADEQQTQAANEGSALKRRKVISTQHRACLDPSMRWRCALCLRTANTAAALAKVECISAERHTYTPAQKHDLWQSTYFRGHFVYCRLCGLYSNIKTQLLKSEPCRISRTASILHC